MLEHGADVRLLAPRYLVSAEGTTASIRKVLQILLAHGYDINSNGPGGTVLECIGFDDHELLKWCIDEGANVNPPDNAPPDNAAHENLSLSALLLRVTSTHSSLLEAKRHLSTAILECSLER